MRDLLSGLNNYAWPASYASDRVNDISAFYGIISIALTSFQHSKWWRHKLGDA